MNKEKHLLKEINNYIHDLGTQEIKKREEAQFFREFLKIYDVTNIDSYNDVTNTSYLMCVLMAEDINMPFKDLIKIIDQLAPFVDDAELDRETYSTYLKTLEKLYNLGIIDKVKKPELIKDFNDEQMKAFNSYKKINQELFTFEKNEDENLVYLSKVNDAYIELFKILPQPDKYESYMDLVMAPSIIEFIKQEVQDNIRKAINVLHQESPDSTINKVLKKERKRIIECTKRFFFEKEIGQNLKNTYDHFVNYSNALQKQVKDEVSGINKKISKLDTFLHRLGRIQKDVVVDVTKYEEFLFEPKIRKMFMEFAIEHNLAIYSSTENQNKEYKNNKINKVEMLFNKYGFDFNSLLIEEQELIIKASETKNIENILSCLKYSDLVFLTEYHEAFTAIIIDGLDNIIQGLDCALKNKIIDKKFIINNLDILSNEQKYHNLSKNINLLTINGIDLINITKVNPILLTMDNEVLILVFNILKEYNFKLNKDNNFEILVNTNLLDIIDNFIELGMINTIRESQKYLNKEAYNIVKRILISNLIGMNPLNSSNKLIGQIATGNKFYVSSDKYDNYIINEEVCYLNSDCVSELEHNKRLIISDNTKNNDAIAKLDEYYYKNNLTYEIAGINISRNRVLRNFEVLKQNSDMSMTDILYQSIIYKISGNISDDKLIEIYNHLKSLDLEKNKIYKK